MKFVGPSRADSVRMNMGNVPSELTNVLPPTLQISAVICGRIKGQGISFKGIEMQYLFVTRDEVVVYGKGASVLWRHPLSGLRVEKQSIDALRFVSSSGDEIRFGTGAPKRGEMIAHVEQAVLVAGNPSPLPETLPPPMVAAASVPVSATTTRAVNFPVHVAMARGVDLTEGMAATMMIDHTHVRLFDHASSSLVLEVANSDLVEFVTGGPGEVTSGGGFFGGGFGVQGAITGMAIATALNALTSRSQIQTTVRFSTTNFTVALFSNQNTPDEIDLVAPAIVAKPLQSNGSLADEISKLAELHTSGILTTEEFAAAKSRLLNNS